MVFLGEMSLKVISPVNGKVFIERNYSTDDEIDEVIRKSKEAFSQWRSTPIEERCRIASLSLQKIKEKKSLLAEELTYQMGRPIRFAPKEIDGYIERAEYMISKARTALEPIKISEESNGVIKFIKKEPLGVILVLAAWNYPYLIAVNSVIPAICAGI